MDRFIPLTKAHRVLTDAIARRRILRVLYVRVDEEVAIELRLAPFDIGGTDYAPSLTNAHTLYAHLISKGNERGLSTPRVMGLDVRRFISIEDTDEVFDPVALNREQRLVQLEGCLDLVLARFRSWVPSLDDLEDCRACVLARLWNQSTVHQLIDGARFAELNAWLHRCIRNELLNRHRLKTREDTILARAMAENPPPTSPYQSSEFNLQLQQTLHKLPPHQARLVILAYVEGLSYEEIALREGRSLEAVKKALSRARATIRDQWDLGKLNKNVPKSVSTGFSTIESASRGVRNTEIFSEIRAATGVQALTNESKATSKDIRYAGRED